MLHGRDNVWACTQDGSTPWPKLSLFCPYCKCRVIEWVSAWHRAMSPVQHCTYMTLYGVNTVIVYSSLQMVVPQTSIHSCLSSELWPHFGMLFKLLSLQDVKSLVRSSLNEQFFWHFDAHTVIIFKEWIQNSDMTGDKNDSTWITYLATLAYRRILDLCLNVSDIIFIA